MIKQQEKRGKPEIWKMSFKLETYLILANNPHGISTSKIYFDLEKRFNVRKIRSKKWVRDTLANLKNEGILRESRGAWMLEETLEAYCKLSEKISPLHYLMQDEQMTPRWPAREFYNSAYTNLIRKKYKITQVHIAPSPDWSKFGKILKEQKQDRAKVRILLLLANNLDGVDTSVITKNMKEEFGIRSKRWIWTILKKFEDEGIVKRKSRREKGEPTIWKLKQTYNVALKLNRFFSRAGKPREIDKTPYYYLMWRQFPQLPIDYIALNEIISRGEK